MLNIEGTPVGDTLEKVFSAIGSDNTGNYLRSLLIGATRVRHTLVMPLHSTDLRSQPERLRLSTRYGVLDDRRCGEGRLSENDKVLRLIMEVPSTVTVHNLHQVVVVGLDDSLAIARGMGVGYIPYGVQGENLLLEDGVSALSHGMLLTFFSPDGEPRQASLYVIGGHAPNSLDQVHEYIAAQFASPPARRYADVSHGKRGVVAAVKTSGHIWPNDVAVIWRQG